ncbi:MAG TPA: hypothetical protein VND19_19000 [Acetobacteraceae bacterium]|nr:hypothetical protein [Acetobacteraceae bacterium]
MSRTVPDRRCTTVLATCLAVGLAATGSARASVITTSPTLPLLGIPYGSPTGPGCFSAIGVCVTPGTFTQTAIVSSGFGPSGQDIVTDTTFTAALTTLTNAPLGSVALTGTLEEEVLGRTSATELGTWATDLVAMSLSGPALGHTLTLTLDSLHPSVGTTSIAPFSSGNVQEFQVQSFFDVFVDLSLDGAHPRSTTVGPILVAAGVPEPASLTLLALPLLALSAARRRRR